LFVRQTGSRYPILEVCDSDFSKFRDCGCHFFLPRIVTKSEQS